MGHSINILPVLLEVSPSESLIDFFRRLWDIQTQWTRYEYTQIDKVYDWCEISRENPLFESFIVMQNLSSANLDVKAAKKDSSTWNRDSQFFYAKMEYPLRFDIFTGLEICLILNYYRRFFVSPVLKGVLENLRVLIEAVLENPDRTVSEFMNLIDPGKYKLYEKPGIGESFVD
jgi:hypothetical protein